MLLETDLLRPDQPFILRQPRPDLADDQAFLGVCRAHPDLRIESDQEGTLIVMSPTGGWTRGSWMAVRSCLASR